MKYKKHKKAPAGAVGKNHAISVLHHPAALTKLQQQQLATVAHLATEKHKESPGNALPPHLVNGLILKTALTNPSEVRETLSHTLLIIFMVCPFGSYQIE